MGIKFFEFNSKQKLLDIMSQHCGPLDEWPYVQPLQHIKTLLFWHGDTSVIPDKESDRKETGLETGLE